MQTDPANQYPRVHNAMWPGLVGKGPDSEPPIDLKTMLDLTQRAEAKGQKFDGVDLFLADPHTSIDSSPDQIRRLADDIGGRGLAIGSLVAPIWGATGGGSAMGGTEDRDRFLTQVRKACAIASALDETGVRQYGIVRIDSASGVSEWASDPEANTKRIVETFREASRIAQGEGQKLAAEGEICWGGMHGWRKMLRLLQDVGEPEALGFQADMAHTLLYLLGYNAPEDRLLPEGYDWKDGEVLDEALQTLTSALRPWTVDFHVAQNDATVKGSGSHDKTGRHCLPNDPNGKLDIVRHAGFWLRDEHGNLTEALKHICWDGCMFPNEVLLRQDTWNSILATMIAVRDAHGWTSEDQRDSQQA